MTATAAAFGIRRTNVPEADPRGFFRQIGAGSGRGVEAELTGRLARGLGMTAGYAWTSTAVTRDLAADIGSCRGDWR